EFYFIRQIEPEAGIAIRMIAYRLTIQIYICIHIDPLKEDVYTLIFLAGRNSKCLAVPAASSDSKTAAYLIDRIRIKRRIGSCQVFNAPVMWKVHHPPMGIVESGIFSPFHPSSVKTSVIIEE